MSSHRLAVVGRAVSMVSTSLPTGPVMVLTRNCPALPSHSSTRYNVSNELSSVIAGTTEKALSLSDSIIVNVPGPFV